MIFHWEDGQSVEVRAGALICGLSKSGKRPVSVELDYADMRALFSADGVGVQYVVDTVAKCLVPARKVAAP